MQIRDKHGGVASLYNVHVETVKEPMLVCYNGAVTRSVYCGVVDVGSAEGLAYDPVFRELYWTSYTNSSISRISLSAYRSNARVEKIIQLGPEDHPRAIVLDTCYS